MHIVGTFVVTIRAAVRTATLADIPVVLVANSVDTPVDAATPATIGTIRLVTTLIVLVATAVTMLAHMSGAFVTVDTMVAAIHAATSADMPVHTAIDYSVAMPVFTAVGTPVATAHAASSAIMFVATLSAIVVTTVAAAFDFVLAGMPVTFVVVSVVCGPFRPIYMLTAVATFSVAVAASTQGWRLV